MVEQISVAGHFKVGSLLPLKLKHELTAFLAKNADVFAWSASICLGSILKLQLISCRHTPQARPVKQKKRTMDAEKHRAVAKEVDKLLEAGFFGGSVSRVAGKCCLGENDDGQVANVC